MQWFAIVQQLSKAESGVFELLINMNHD